MKNKILVFFTLVSLISTTQAIAFIKSTDNKMFTAGQEITQTHNTIKSVSLRMSLDDDLNGLIESKVCSFCQTIKIKVTPDTIAYDNNVKVPLQQAKERIGRFATVIYDLKTNNVKRYTLVISLCRN